MNYEKIIIELLGRIQVLEEQMATILEGQNSANKKITKKTSTSDILEYIEELKEDSRKEGKKIIVLRSGNIHTEMGLHNALPQVCNAMRQAMKDSDVVLHTTPSGYSSTIEIQYSL